MKKPSLKKIELRKTAVSNLQSHPEIDEIKGGQANKAFTPGCLKNTTTCDISERMSCYSPCGSDFGTFGCTPS